MARGPRDPLSKVKKAESLKRLLASARKSRKKVVFTNGVFDLLHPGHVTYLHQARKLGDLLVVALNEDESVRKLKGPTRPVNRLSDRLLTLAGLECVDYVTWFGDETPLRLVNLLRPHVLVKGGDYSATAPEGSPKYIVGTKEVRAWGGKSRALPFVEGHSTTKTISRMR
jgi:D-beta-D-heptose 7-phosphate kinase/D-beta-D-heptose 1-phosphate adenosyltransferase